MHCQLPKIIILSRITVQLFNTKLFMIYKTQQLLLWTLLLLQCLVSFTSLDIDQITQQYKIITNASTVYKQTCKRTYMSTKTLMDINGWDTDCCLWRTVHLPFSVVSTNNSAAVSFAFNWTHLFHLPFWLSLSLYHPYWHTSNTKQAY